MPGFFHMFIKVLKAHPHGGMIRKAGTVYDCPDKKARLMVSIGKAEKYEEPKTVRKKVTKKKATAKRGPGRPRKTEAATYATKVMTAEE